MDIFIPNGYGRLIKSLANMTVYGIDEYAAKLSLLGSNTTSIAKKVVIAGANPIADEIRKGIENIQNDKFRKLTESDAFSGISEGQRKDLLDSLGITPADIDFKENTNVKVGFDGYGSYPTIKYPQGVPNQLLARAIESGSSVRGKTPFVRKAVNKTKAKAIEEMGKTLDKEIQKIGL